MKSIWSGSISFGLVNIPVHMYSAISEHSFGMNILCAKCHTPLHNIRWCEHCKKEIDWKDTVKGFKKSNGSYFIMTHEAIEKLKPKKMDVIDIKEFVNQSDIEMLYVDNHYYIMPSKKENKAFYLFAQALKSSKKVAIGQCIMREKEYVVAISFYNNILLLNTLHYHNEIRTLNTKNIKPINPTQKELSLALMLINKFTHKKFDLSKYKNTFVEKLKKTMKSAKASKVSPKKTIKKTTSEKSKQKKDSLTNALQQSLRQHEVRA